MAKKEKKPAVMLDLNIKMASKTKASKPDQLTQTDPKIVAAVDKCIELDRKIENLQAEQAIQESLVTESADALRDAEFDKGNFAKTVNVNGTTHKLQVQFKDAYSKMDIGMKDPLKTVFGDKFEVLFKINDDDELIDAKKDELKALLGTRWSEFFANEKTLQPQKDFQQTTFSLRNSLKPAQVDAIEKIIDACQAKPSVKYPK
jgi:hypothetical protein